MQERWKTRQRRRDVLKNLPPAHLTFAYEGGGEEVEEAEIRLQLAFAHKGGGRHRNGGKMQ